MKKISNHDNYKDIKLKEKDYNNDKDLAFFIEQEKKAKEMLKEVENFRKSFYLSKFVDFEHILNILDYVKWIEITKENCYVRNYLNLYIFIPKIEDDLDLTKFAKLNSEQNKKFIKKYKHKFGTCDDDLVKFYYCSEHEEYREVEYLAEKERKKVINSRLKLVDDIIDRFKSYDVDYNKKINPDDVENEINDKFGDLIREYILKNKELLKISNINSKYLLTDKNIAIKIPSLSECTIEISDNEKQVKVESDGDRSWEEWYTFPSYIGKRHNITERLEVTFDCETNEYVSHIYVYSHDIEDIRR